MPVLHKETGEAIGAVPTARPEDLDAAMDAAQRAAPLMGGEVLRTTRLNGQSHKQAKNLSIRSSNFPFPAF